MQSGGGSQQHAGAGAHGRSPASAAASPSSSSSAVSVSQQQQQQQQFDAIQQQQRQVGGLILILRCLWVVDFVILVVNFDGLSSIFLISGVDLMVCDDNVGKSSVGLSLNL